MSAFATDTRGHAPSAELDRHRLFSSASAAALTLAVLATATSFTMEAFTHTGSLVQLLAVSILLLVAQAGALSALLLRPLVLRIVAGILGLAPLVLMGLIGFGDFWVLPAATAVVLITRTTENRWLRVAAAVFAVFVAASLALWADHASMTAVVRMPMVVASVLALLAGLILLLNFVIGRSTWALIVAVSGVSLGLGGLIGFGGAMMEAAGSEEGSLTFILAAVGMLGTSKLDIILALVTSPVIVIVGVVLLMREPGEESARRIPGSPTVSALTTALVAATLIPALTGLVSNDLGAIVDFLLGFVYTILWVACLVVWYRTYGWVVAGRLPLTSLTPDHALVIGLIVLSPLVRGLLAWVGVMREGGPIFENL